MSMAETQAMLEAREKIVQLLMNSREDVQERIRTAQRRHVEAANQLRNVLADLQRRRHKLKQQVAELRYLLSRGNSEELPESA